MKNFIIIQIARYTPFLSVKNWLYRTFTDESRKENIICAYGNAGYYVPEKITVGENSIIGYNTTILAHEYLIREYRLGEIVIGNEVMIGANVTILPGVKIGDGATVSAGTLVHRDVPSGAFVGGNPMRIIYTKEQMTAEKVHGENVTFLLFL